MLLLDDELFSCTPFLCICSFVLFVWRSALAGTRVGSPGVSLGKLHTDSKGTLESCRERGTARLG